MFGTPFELFWNVHLITIVVIIAVTVLLHKLYINKSEDLKLDRELLNDSIEIAEHNMLVDLHWYDLGRVAKFGSV